MSILVIGDPHFKTDNTDDTQAMCEGIYKAIAKYEPKLCVILGDTIDEHETSNYLPLKMATEFLHQVSSKVKTFLLIGNHDLKNNTEFLTDNHFFNSFKYWGERLTVVDYTLRWNDYVFVPYVEPGRFMEAVSKVDIEGVKLIFAHQQFKGANMIYITHKDGDEWPKDKPPVISGHVHVYQRLEENVLYVGSPIQHASGDTGRKTISYFNSENLDDEVRIDLGVRRNIEVKIRYDQVSTYIPPENCNVRISIEGSNEENITASKHANIDKWKEEGHVVHYKTKIDKRKRKKLKYINMPYSQLVLDKVRDDEVAVKVYTEIVKD
jgi:DNA repair exonuclease SbcCD nuclease subunit